MAKRRVAPSEPSCPRCGNEEDLREWLDGNVYCMPCIECPHGSQWAICPTCLRQLHSVMTFEGPRIVDIAYYVAEAWREYGFDASELLTWSFAEQGRINEFYDDWSKSRTFGVTAPPPHHRFTSRDGSS